MLNGEGIFDGHSNLNRSQSEQIVFLDPKDAATFPNPLTSFDEYKGILLPPAQSEGTESFPTLELMHTLYSSNDSVQSDHPDSVDLPDSIELGAKSHKIQVSESSRNLFSFSPIDSPENKISLGFHRSSSLPRPKTSKFSHKIPNPISASIQNFGKTQQNLPSHNSKILIVKSQEESSRYVPSEDIDSNFLDSDLTKEKSTNSAQQSPQIGQIEGLTVDSSLKEFEAVILEENTLPHLSENSFQHEVTILEVDSPSQFNQSSGNFFE